MRPLPLKYVRADRDDGAARDPAPSSVARASAGRSVAARLAGAATFVALFLNLLLVRSLTAADERRVAILGYELSGACGFQDRFGALCPFCGATRAGLLALRGELWRAAQLNFAATLAVSGALLLVAALGFVVAFRAETDPRGETRARARRVFALACALYLAVVLATLVCQCVWRLSARV